MSATERPGQVLVRLRFDSARGLAGPPLFPGASVLRRLDAGVAGRLRPAAGRPAPAGGLYLLQLKPGADARGFARSLARRADVAYAEPNLILHISALPPDLPQKLPDDFEFGSQPGLRNTNFYNGKPGADIAAPQAWAFTTGSRAVRVAVIDTGIDYFHPDLAANIWSNPGEIPGNGLDDDGNGLVDDVHGYDFVSHDSDPMDDHSHGTHVAGIIGAVGDNGIGVAGVCWQISLMAVKAFDQQGEGDVAAAIEAIDYARKNGARIINASWGVPEKSRALEDAVAEARAAGMVFIAAAGNDHSAKAPVPAGIPGVIAVAALTASNNKADFSNYGPFVAVSAPGQDVYSTAPNAGYQFLSGTSMAAPHVSGVAALILSQHPDFTGSDVENILRNSVDPVDSESQVGGRINAAVALGANATPPPVPYLDVAPRVSGVVAAMGGATIRRPLEAVLEVGTGANPSQWRSITNTLLTMESPSFFAAVDSTGLKEGTNTLRLSLSSAAPDGLSQVAVTRSTIKVGNTQITSPQSADILRHGGLVPVRGTAFGADTKIAIEVGSGIQPAQWSATGITLRNSGPQGWVDTVLADWDTSTVAADHHYMLRLTSSNTVTGLSQTNFAGLLFLDSRLRPGWPQTVPFAGGVSEDDWRTAQAVDLDGDGRQEIVLVQSASDAPARLIVFSGDGSVRWQRGLPEGDSSADIPVVGDLDGDGQPEIVVEADSRLWAFHADGSNVEGAWPVALAAGRSGKAIAPLRVGTNVLVTLSNLSINKGGEDFVELAVYDSAGRLLREWDVPACPAPDDVMRQGPAIADLLPDVPGSEIIVPHGCGGVACYNLSFPSGPLWMTTTPGIFLISPVIGDLDGDGALEIVMASKKSEAPNSGGIYVFDAHGKKWPGFPALREDSFTTPLALGDVRGDGRLCIAAVGEKLRKVHLLESDGFEAPGWPSAELENRSVRTSPTLADVDGDGRPEVIVALPGYSSLANRENNTDRLGGVQAWRANGQPLPLHDGAGFCLLPIEANSAVVYHKSSPVIAADLDGDGVTDLVALSINERAFAPRPQESPSKQRFSVTAWRTSGIFSPASAPWPGLSQNPMMTGLAAPSPNLPARPAGSIRLLGQEDQPVTVDITSRISGDLVGWHDGKHGAVSMGGAPSLLIYQPVSNYNGGDRFTVDIRESAGGIRPVEIEVFLQPRNDPPRGANFSITLNKNKSADIFFTATDPDEDTPTYRIVQAPLHGYVWNYPGLANYVPYHDYTGPDFLTYAASDGRRESEPIVVGIQVTGANNAPEAQALARTTAVNQPVEMELHGADADGDVLTFEISKPPLRGSLSAQGSHWRYRPAPDFEGRDTFEFRAFDGRDYSRPALGAITVTTNNTAPVATPGFFSTARNVPMPLHFNAVDLEGNPVWFDVTIPPRHGAVNETEGRWTYTPNVDYAGPDRLWFTARDLALTSSPVAATITVARPNSPPQSSNGDFTLTTPSPFAFRLPVADKDEDPLQTTILAGSKHGRLFGSGVDWTYVPDPDFLGSDSFTFKIWDGSAYSKVSSITLRRVDLNAPLRLAIEGSRINSDGQTLTLLVTIPKIAPMRVETSSDLIAWRSVQDVQPLTSRFDLTVDISSGAHLYFRLVVP